MPGINATAETDAPGAGVTATWTYTLGSVVFFFAVIDAILVFELTAQFTLTSSTIDLLLVLLVLVASAAQIHFCWFLRAGSGGGLPYPGWVATLLAPAALAWGLSFLPGTMTFMAVVPLWLSAALIFCLVPKSIRWAVLGGAAALCVAPLIVSDSAPLGDVDGDTAGRFGMLVIYAVGMPFIMLASLWWWNVVVRLDDSRKVAAELAVTQERLRFAADLHDIQGHHLQVIALKSELAERLMQQEPVAAAAQVHEIRVIAKQALEETRSLVAGLREVALEDELQNAQEVLSLTGAECRLEIESPPADARIARALALTVREGTTNILRHSEATSASIELRCGAGVCDLVLANNGADGGSGSLPATPGTGLDGLRHRIEELGGSLEATQHDNSFVLRARIPTPAATRA